MKSQTDTKNGKIEDEPNDKREQNGPKGELRYVAGRRIHGAVLACTATSANAFDAVTLRAVTCRLCLSHFDR